MFLMYDSTDMGNRMFKTSAWNMLHTQKEWYVQDRPIMIGSIDCSMEANLTKQWCKKFIAFDISNLSYPIIGYSYNNEPFKHYDGSLEYPALTKFLFEYFERNCATNSKWCDEETKLLLDMWNPLSLRDKMLEHIKLMEASEKEVNAFTSYRVQMKRQFQEEHDRVEKSVAARDKKAKILMTMIQKYARQKIEDVTEIIELDRVRKLDRDTSL